MATWDEWDEMNWRNCQRNKLNRAARTVNWFSSGKKAKLIKHLCLAE